MQSMGQEIHTRTPLWRKHGSKFDLSLYVHILQPVYVYASFPGHALILGGQRVRAIVLGPRSLPFQSVPSTQGTSQSRAYRSSMDQVRTGGLAPTGIGIREDNACI